MDCIAVIDDREKQRGTLVKYIGKGLARLGVDWRVIDSPPFADIGEYATWVATNEVRVLVLDEKLDEEFSGEAAVDYSGHQIAIRLRKELPDLPQVIITAVADSDDLDGAGELDAIVGRDEFFKHADIYVERMVRLGMSFVDRNETELAEITRLSEKLIKEDLDARESERLQALREKIGSVANAMDSEGMREWLSDAVSVQASLEEVLRQLREELKK
jgi:CheY-like chemotaxis protein